MSEPTTPGLPSPTRRFFGGLLMVVGGLIAALCGLCGSVFVLAGLWTALTSHARDGTEISVMGFFMGGIPTAVGVGLFVAGRSLRRP